MTPKTKGRHAAEPAVLYKGTRPSGYTTPLGRNWLSRWGPVLQRLRSANTNDKMTLCGSEVPQDRWRGRTAGSGMWTLTRDNLLSWSLDDPAITYG